MKKTVYIKDDEAAIMEIPGLKSVGGYNDMPEPCREITSDEYWHRWGVYCTNYEEHRQVRVTESIGMRAGLMGIHIYWYGNFGLGLAPPTKWRCGKKEKNEHSIVYEDKPRYFYFGCDHDWKRLSAEEAKELGRRHLGMHWNVCQCRKCKDIWEYDSSG